MFNLLVNQLPDTSREYIAYRPPTVSRFNGPVVVYLYTDNAQPDAWMDSFGLGKRFKGYVPAATVANILELRSLAGAALSQNATNASVREALERAVTYLGWTKSVNGEEYGGGY